MNYPVNELFETIQGEAEYTGTPALFIRLQGCPVGCPWCDTKHTWELEKANEQREIDIIRKDSDSPTYCWMSTAQLVDIAVRSTVNHVVITGGEPCMYDLLELTTELIREDMTVQIETSGTYEISAHWKTWVTLSPKIDMPGGLEVLESAISRADEIKFPVGKMRDIKRALQFLPGRVWLQPLSQSAKATELCVEQAIECGFLVSVQTHKYMGVR